MLVLTATIAGLLLAIVAARRTLRRWWWGIRTEMQLPYHLAWVAQSLSRSDSELARRALHDLMEDYRQLRSTGADDRDYDYLADRWERVADKLHHEAFTGQLSVERFEAVLASFADLDKIDHTKDVP